MATQQPITRICSQGAGDRVYLQLGVVELVRSNLAPDFPLFHAPATLPFTPGACLLEAMQHLNISRKYLLFIKTAMKILSAKCLICH